MRSAPTGFYTLSVRRQTFRVLSILTLTAAAVGSSLPGPAGAQEEWRSSGDSVVRYEIDARLRKAPGKRDRLRIVGTQRVEWRNTSQDAVSSVYLHLYANAFSNTRSSFLREAALTGWTVPDDMEWGGIELQEFALASGQTLTPEFVQPDDGNPDDRTVVRVALPEAVPAGGTLGLRIKFTTSLPTIIARMGRHRDFVMAAQWFPKLGRYVGTDVPRNQEGWYCHQFHRNTEFYADFADYEVRLSVSDDLVTGATGTLAASEEGSEDGIRVETWKAESVVDFAWTASRHFSVVTRTVDPEEPSRGRTTSNDPINVEQRRIAKLLGVEAETLDLPPVEVTLLIQPEHVAQTDRHFEAVRVALGLYGLWLGPYPYSRLTVLDPPHGGGAAGGMEYPMLFTAGTRIGRLPESLRPEGVTVHEAGHQWFMNLLASNEAEEAWLDEGLNTYFTARALHAGYGPAWEVHRSFGRELKLARMIDFDGMSAAWPEKIGLPEWARPPRMETFEEWRDLPRLTQLPARRWISDPLIVRRRRYLRRAGWDELSKPSWMYVDRRSYGVNAYSRPALFIATLRRTLHAEHGREEGERRFVVGMREYARVHRFRHPTGADFIETFGQATGLDMAPLVAALMDSSGVMDYAVESIKRVKPPNLVGRVERDGGIIEVSPVDENDGEKNAEKPPVETEVMVRRVGEVVLPVRLRVMVEDEDGKRTASEHSWDGRERWHRVLVPGKVVSAQLHPFREYPQDVNRHNDSRTKEENARPGVKWGVRFLNWLENAALSYGRFF